LKDKDQRISFEDEISEGGQAEQSTPQQELCAMPPDTSDRETVERTTRSIEVEHFSQVESKHKMNSMSVEASEHVTITQIEKKQVQQVEITHELDSMLICSREHSDETLEGERTVQAGLEQECEVLGILSTITSDIFAIGLSPNQYTVYFYQNLMACMMLICRRFLLSFGRSWDAVTYKQPWPPPMHVVILGDGLSVRLTPWQPFDTDIYSFPVNRPESSASVFGIATESTSVPMIPKETVSRQSS
jgi:hypothetical protein